MTSTSKNNKRGIANKIAGAFYGFAIGDAMGATTEFMSARQIHKKYDMVCDIIGGGWLNLKPGQVTDDTEMMLCVAEGYQASIVNGTSFVGEVSKRFVDWYKDGPIDCGYACMAGIKRIMLGKDIRCDNAALGNGALMRALPMAIAGRLDLNLAQSDLTHCNSTHRHFVREYHNMIVRQIYGNGHGTGIRWNPDKLYCELGMPTGHVANTLYCAVDANKEASKFEHVIVKCVNGGGDADTIAAIAGGLAGAKYGFECIPSRWVGQLDPGVSARLDGVINFLVKHVNDQCNATEGSEWIV